MPIMRLSWRRDFPGWPAILLIPAVLGAWAWVCAMPLTDLGAASGAEWHRGGGVPYEFWRPKLIQISPRVWRPPARGEDSGYRFKPVPFIADLAIALALAYGLAMVMDRGVFPWLRRRQGQERATPPGPS